MKVAIFTGTIVLNKNNLSVRSIYIMERLRYLTKYDDLDLTLVCPSDISEEIKKLNFIPYKFTNKKHFRYISTVVFSFLKLLTLDCDVLHCYSNESASVALIAQIFRKKKIPILFEPMGLAAEESRITARSSLKARILRPVIVWRENTIFRHSIGVIIYTEILKEYTSKYHKFPKNNIFVVPHGIDIELFAKNYKKDLKLIRKLGLENKRIIMYIGSISELHGTLNLIKAIELINNKIKDVVLVIVGAGGLQSQVEKYVKKNQLNNVIFAGLLPHNEIPKYYSIADILVIPHAKCMQTELDPPTKIFEYLASGKPIVASNLKPIVDIVGDNAILVEPENPQAFAEGILKLLSNEELAKRMGENGKKIICKYSWEESAKKQYEAYKHLLSLSETHT